MNGKILITLILFFLFASCSQEAGDELKSIVENEVISMDGSSISPAMVDLMEDNEILIFGETHYVQEHQDYLVGLLPELSAQGYKVIFQELFNAFSWMVNDYILGEVSEIPEFLLYFDATLIEGIKKFNTSVEDDDKIQLVYMDVNHWEDNFSRSIEAIKEALGGSEIIDELLALDVNANNYKPSLLSIHTSFQSQPENHISELGEKWFLRIDQLIRNEITSHDIRTNGSSQQREEFMRDIIVSHLESFSGDKILINTGMYHAQKNVFMGNNIIRLRQLLDNKSHEIESIAFVGIRGFTKSRFNETKKTPFDLVEKATGDDLIKIMDEYGSRHKALLPLNHNYFDNDIRISYLNGTTITAPIGQQFDAIITFPEISVLKSMDIYDWRR